MARSYEEASATRRARLPMAARSDRAVFEQTYRLAVQVMERRELLGLTQTELAQKTGIDQGDISRIERGSIFPNEKTRLASPTPSVRNGDCSTSRRPESSSTVGVTRRKVLVSGYAPRTRSDRGRRNARMSAPGVVAGLAPCAYRVVTGRPLLLRRCKPSAAAPETCLEADRASHPFLVPHRG